MRNELTSLIASKSRKYNDAVAAVSRAEKHTRDSIINAVSSTDEVRQLNSEIADIESRKKDRKQALAQEFLPLESKISDLKNQRQKIIDELYRLKDAVESAKSSFKSSESNMNSLKSIYANNSTSENYNSYCKAFSDYKSKMRYCDETVARYNSNVPSNKDKARVMDWDISSVETEIRNKRSQNDQVVAELDNQRTSLLNQIDDKYREALTKHLSKDPRMGAGQYRAVLNADFGFGKFASDASSWLNRKFEISRSAVIPENNEPTPEASAIYRYNTNEYQLLGTKVRAYETLYNQTIADFKAARVTFDGRDYTDLDFFYVCIAEDTNSKWLVTQFQKAFKIGSYTSPSNFLYQTLTLEEVEINGNEMAIQNLKFVALLPSLRSLSIPNSKITDFQPLFDIKFGGKLDVRGSQLEHKEIKKVCKALKKQFGAECMYD